MDHANKPPFRPRADKILPYLRPDLCPFRAAQRALADGETGEPWRQRIAALPPLLGAKQPVDLLRECIERRRWSEAEALGASRSCLSKAGHIYELISSADDAAWEWIERLHLRPAVSPCAGDWLAVACRTGRADWVSKLIEWGASPNAPVHDHVSRSVPVDLRLRPLALAVGLGERECARVLLEAGANPNHVARDEWNDCGGGLFPLPGDRHLRDSHFTPLMLAEITGDSTVEADLIRHGSDPDSTRRLGLNSKDYHRFRVLRDPTRPCYRKVIHALRSGAPIEEVAAHIAILPKLKWNLFVEACVRGRSDVLRHLIDLDILEIQGRSNTSLQTLAAGGEEVVALLLANKYRDTEGKVNDDSETLLSEACATGDAKLARKILEAGYPANQITSHNFACHYEELSPLMQAVRVGSTACVEALIKHGADVNLGVRLFLRGRESFEQMIKTGSSPFPRLGAAEKEYFLTPLLLAEAVENQSAIALLLAQGAHR